MGAATADVIRAEHRRARQLDGHQLAERYRMLGHDPDAPLNRALIARGIAPVAGAATGLAGMAFARNLPAEGSFVMNPDEFAKWTERNDMPLEQRDFPALGGAPIDQRIPAVGIAASLRIVLTATLTTAGAGTVTSTYQWPWNLIKRFNLNVNGQTSILSCEGMDLRARRQRIFRNPREEVSSAPATDTATGNPNPGVIANGAYNVVLVYDVPIAHDVWTLVGSLYAQSDATYLNFRLTPAASAELFTLAGGSTATITNAKVSTTLTFYDIPTSRTQRGDVILVPDLRYLHGFFSSDKPFANTGEVSVEMIRSSGQLLCYYLYLDNGGAAQIDPAAWSELRVQYGGNRRPRTYNPLSQLLEKNGQDYNGRIKPGYALIDLEADNVRREGIYPKGVTELAAVVTVASGTTINANARAHQVEETLFAGV